MRNVALDSILDVAQEEDLILYGDLDELPSMATIQKVVRARIEEFPFVLQMPLYRTNFGCLDRALYGEKQWAGTIGENNRFGSTFSFSSWPPQVGGGKKKPLAGCAICALVVL